MAREPVIIREVFVLADGATSAISVPEDSGSLPLPQSGRIIHLAVVGNAAGQAPLWASATIQIQRKSMFVVEGWVRGYSNAGGGGISIPLDLPLKGDLSNWIGVSVRNDTGGELRYIIEAVVVE